MSVYNETCAVLRTNPKLTGNLKLIVDSSGQIYLNSIDANDQLADSRFKRKLVNPNSFLANDISRFFDGGNFPTSLIFDVLRKYNNTQIHDSFSKQFEQQYNSGVFRNNYGSIVDPFSIFAPIWIDKQIPKYFIVFKNPNPKNFAYEKNPAALLPDITYRVIDCSVRYGATTYVSGDSFVASNGISYQILSGDGYIIIDDTAYEKSLNTSPSNFIKNFVSPSDIVKVFDLTENSKLGGYLRNHVNDKQIKQGALFVNFDTKTVEYNGISVKSGIVCTIVENIEHLFEKEIDQIEFDDYITSGFERNGLVSCNLLNLEFTFDDTNTTEYTFNRYFGFYADDIDVGTFYADKSLMFARDGLYPNKFCDKNTIPLQYGTPMEDSNGIAILPDIAAPMSGHLFDTAKIVETPTFYYIKNIKGEFNKVENLKSTEKVILNKKSDITSNWFGFNSHFEIEAQHLSNPGKSVISFDVLQEHYTSYKIELRYKNSTICFVYGDHLPDNVEPYGEGDNIGYYYYPYGSKENIAKAIAKAWQQTFLDNNILMNVVAIGEKVLIYTRSVGDGNNFYSIHVTGEDGYISIYDKKFGGGTYGYISRVLVDKDIPLKITDKSFILTKSGFSRIDAITPYIDEPIYDSNGDLSDFKDFEKYVVVSIIDEEPIVIQQGKVSFYNEEKLAVGCFSFYSIKDIDTDTFASDYNRNYQNELKKYYFTEPDNLEKYQTYKVLKVENDNNPVSISYFDSFTTTTYVENDEFTFNAGGDSFYKVITGSPVIINVKFLEDPELKKFIGFNTLITEIDQLPINIDDADIRNKYQLLRTSGDKTEYDRLRENLKLKNALTSKIVPTINKWVLKNANNVRDAEYRLTLSKAFGELNFSPSFIDESQNPIYFTHEWCYIGSLPENISNEDLFSSKAYFSQKFDIDRSADLLKDYFSQYFTIDEYLVNQGTQFGYIEVPTQRRYSTFTKSYGDVFETFFRGFKLKLTAKNKDYSNYKFSTVLNYYKTEFLVVKEPFKITVVENQDFKNITFVIDIVIDDYKIVPDLAGNEMGEYLFLYVMESLKRYDVFSGFYQYGIDFNFPTIIGADIFNAYGTSVPVPPPITSFKGTQLFNKLKLQGVSSPDIMRFDVSKFLLSETYKVNDNANYGYLIGIDTAGAVFMTAKDVVYSASQLIIDKANSVLSVNAVNNSDVKLDVSGLAILSIPGVYAIGNYDPLYVNSGIYDLANVVWFNQGGGKDIYKDVAKLTSFASIFNIINQKDSRYLNYVKIKNGAIESNSVDFSIEFVKPSQIKLNDSVSVEKIQVIDPDLSNENLVDYTNKSTEKSSLIYRYSGYYQPKFNDVVKFKNDRLRMTWGLYDVKWADLTHTWMEYQSNLVFVTWNDLSDPWTSYTESWNAIDQDIDNITGNVIPYSRRLYDLNTKFDITTADFGIIKNFWHHKVSNLSNLLKSKNPVYISNGEIAIDTTDLNVFLSSWDESYYKSYKNRKDSDQIHGTFGLQEEKSFFGSKLLNLENQIFLNNFNDKIAINPTLTDIGSNYIGVTENGVITNIIVSARNILVDYIYNNSIAEFTKYVNPFNTDELSLELALKNYIDINVLPFYKINKIQLFVKKFTTEQVLPFVDSSDEITLLQNGYVEDKNFKTENFDSLTTSINYKRMTEFEYSFALKVTVSI